MALDQFGIHNVGEFYSDHYRDAVLEGDLKSIFEKWTAREKENPADRDPTKKLFALANKFFQFRAKALGVSDPVERFTLAHAFHADLLDALGYERSPSIEPLEDGTVIPVLLARTRDGRPFLWIVEAPFSPSDDSEPFAERPRNLSTNVRHVSVQISEPPPSQSA